MSKDISKLFRRAEQEDKGEGGVFFFFTSSRTSYISERLEYEKVWPDDYGYSSHSNYMLVLPDSILPVCIGLVMAYMIYILMSFLIQTNDEELNGQDNMKVAMTTKFQLEDNVIPDKIRQLYEPLKSEVSYDWQFDSENKVDLTKVGLTMTNSYIGVHAGSNPSYCVTPVIKL